MNADEFMTEAVIQAYDAETGELFMKSTRAGVTISRDLKWV